MKDINELFQLLDKEELEVKQVLLDESLKFEEKMLKIREITAFFQKIHEKRIKAN